MSGLAVGTSAGTPFALPLEVAQWAMAIHGVRGKGKTVTAAVIVEEVLAHGVQVVIIDPTDVWWGLKSSRDGTAAGHPVVILGGTHEDIPLHADAGAAVADFAVEHGASMILSLRHLRKGAQARFVTAFAEHLYHRKGEAAHRRPLLLVIDEASRYVPQRVGSEQARMVGAIEDIVRLGRASGFGVVLVDQRPASVNKDVLTQIELLVCHAVTSPQDRKALDDWIRGKDTGGHREEFLEHLASLDRGEAWFWMPIADVFARVNVRMRNTFDSSRTPEIGEDPLQPGVVATLDLDELRGALQASIAEAEASDPKVLRKRVAELESELRRARDRADDEDVRGEAIAEEVDRRLEVALERQREEWLPKVEAISARADGIVERFTAELSEVLQAAQDLVDEVEDPEVDMVAIDESEAAPATPAPPARRRAPTPATNGSGPKGAQLRILNALASLEAVGVAAPSRDNVAVFAGISPKSSAYSAHVSKLRKGGFLDYPADGRLSLLEPGRATARPDRVPGSVQELHDAWVAYLPAPAGRIIRALAAIYPRGMSREDLAEATDQSPRSSAYAAHVADLAGLGLVRYPAAGQVAATERLFPSKLLGARS